MTPLSHTATPHPALRLTLHQQAPLHLSWLSRGLLALVQAQRADQAAQVFRLPEATEHLGLSPAQLRSVRFWLCASGLTVEPAVPHGDPVPRLTHLGLLLARHDPTLEHRASLWLLHARLARNRGLTPLWSWFFQQYAPTTPFSSVAGLEALLAWVTAEAPNQSLAPGVLAREWECFLRLFIPARLLSPEEPGQPSPFQRLGMLTCVQPEAERAERQFCLHPPQRGQLPALVILATLLEQAGAGAWLPLREVLSGPMQVGRTFALRHEDIDWACASVQARVPAWCPQWERQGEQEWLVLPAVSAQQILTHLYQS